MESNQNPDVRRKMEDEERERIRKAIVNDDAVRGIQNFADATNVFSVNTLAAKGVENQVWKKENHNTQLAVNRDPSYFLSSGKALHELIQNHEGTQFKHEIPVALIVPYKWKNINADKVVVWGRIDSYLPATKTVYEISTTSWKESATPPRWYYYKVALMTEAMAVSIKAENSACLIHLYDHERPMGKKTEHIVGINTRFLTKGEVESSLREVVWRAKETARIIDEKVGKGKWANTIHVCTSVRTDLETQKLVYVVI